MRRIKNRVIVNADDLGMSRSANEAIRRAHLEGVLTSASVVVPGEAYRHALDRCVGECPRLGIGLHFSLTAGRAVAPRNQIPLLVDEAGIFTHTFSSLCKALRSTQKNDLLAQIRIELHSQIAQAVADGLRLDHINGERHIHLIPQIFGLVAEAASSWGISFVRTIRESSWNFVRLAQYGTILKTGGFLKCAVLGHWSRVNIRSGVFHGMTADHFIGLLLSGKMYKIMDRVLLKPPPGVTEIMVHPGLPNGNKDEDRLVTAAIRKYLQSIDRVMEFDSCIGRRIGPSVDLIRFQDLGESFASLSLQTV